MNDGVKKMGFVVVAVLVMAGCASKPDAVAAVPTAAEVRRELGANNVENQTQRSSIVEWMNRNLGEPSVPQWLKPLVKGNAEPMKAEFGIDAGARVRYSIAQRANREEARVQAGLLFAAQIASELKTYVMTAAAQTLNEGQIDVIEEITTATKVTVTGIERVADFWQLIETENSGGRAKSREYVYYVAWAMPQATWTALTRKYVNDVVGKIPDQAVQANVARAYGDIQAAADREQEMTDAEFRQKLRMQEQAARDAQAREMARINQETAVAVVDAAARAAEAEARYSAYRSGGTAAAAVATTAGDIDWISALGTAEGAIF